MMAEILRVLSPGGLLVLSTAGHRALQGDELDRLLHAHFPYVCFAGQRMHTGSVIGPLNGHSYSRFITFHHEDDDLESFAGLEVRSRSSRSRVTSPLPALPIGVMDGETVRVADPPRSAPIDETVDALVRRVADLARLHSRERQRLRDVRYTMARLHEAIDEHRAEAMSAWVLVRARDTRLEEREQMHLATVIRSREGSVNPGPPKIKDLFRLQRAVADAPAAVGVVGNLHLDDHVLHFLLNHPFLPDLASSVDMYFTDGRRCALKLPRLLEELGIGRGGPYSLLEFASGYGRVTRFLRAVLLDASVTACDIHEEAVTFIEQELGVRAFRSHRVPEEWRVPRRYDVIFALSFYSHVPRETWARWIRAHVGALDDHGVLIFTTHGRHSLPLLGSPEVCEEGFWFAPRSEQRDLDAADYGVTMVTRAFVEATVAAAVGGRVALYREAAWWRHQDLYVIRRDGCVT